MQGALVLCRFVHYAAVVLLFGGGAFRIYALDGAGNSDALRAYDDWFARVAVACAAAALLSAVGVLLSTAARMAGEPALALDPATIAAVLWATDFGWVWQGRLILAAGLVVICCLLPRPAARRAVAPLSLLLVGSLAAVGHAVMDEGATGLGHEVNDALHLIAAGIWLGGLPPLFWLLQRARREPGSGGLDLAREAVPRFSQTGYVAVGLLVLTGAVNACLLVGTPAALAATPYGRLLLVKIALAAAMVGLALGNRFRLLPRLRKPEPHASVAALARSVVAEQALGAAILAVVSVLGTWPPALHAGM
ncbi:MAG: copper homeostasis membrane protein CopD [Alphaproteobacteria bacterium]|nr:copper homeostasis membrane protein CopD [Alphaproteobacteria bacterium]